MAKPGQKAAREPRAAALGGGAREGARGPRAERAPERRRQIVRAMLEVVAERGYDGASVAEVARRAGLAPGLVHYYFRDKLALALALVGHLGEVAARREGERLSRAPEGGRARALVDAYLARGPGSAPAAVACWVALGAEAVRTPELRQAYGQVLVEASSRLSALLCLDGISTPAGARRDAAALVAAIQGYFQLSIAAPALVPEGSAAEAVRAMVDGLRGRAALERGAPGERAAGARGDARAAGARGDARAPQGAAEAGTAGSAEAGAAAPGRR
ncbi:MAG TPA: TetR family transcriptional regulator [Polyangiaceae bacterium]|nr:TetR family transcriptional regulator [Polyangiaceae bacterium]